jgi:hypothetical protein
VAVKPVFVDMRGIEISWNSLERVRAVRAHHEEKLKQEFVGVGKVIRRDGQMTETVLPTDLTKFAGPIGENSRKTGVCQTRIGRMPAAVKSAAKCPPAVDAVLGIGIEAECMLSLESIGRGELIPGAPEEFVSE